MWKVYGGVVIVGCEALQLHAFKVLDLELGLKDVEGAAVVDSVSLMGVDKGGLGFSSQVDDVEA